MVKQSGEYEYKFTVFTPTHNRVNTLKRVYNSLKKQNYTNFEWVIVDDGSIDNTSNVVRQWMKENFLTIRYFYKENGGKHTAVNLGVREAKGEFFLILDSDDACVPHTLETFLKSWEEIPKTKKDKFTGVTAVGMDFSGNVVGTYYPYDNWDVSHLEILTKYKVKGDKWGFNRTEIMRKFPFPEIEGETFISEGLIWNRISMQYIKRNINEKLKYIEYQSDGLSASSLKIRIKNPKGTRLYYRELISLRINRKWKIRSILNYIRFSLHGKIRLKRIVLDSFLSLLTGILLPIGYLIYIKDLIYLRFTNK